MYRISTEFVPLGRAFFSNTVGRKEQVYDLLESFFALTTTWENPEHAYVDLCSNPRIVSKGSPGSLNTIVTRAKLPSEELEQKISEITNQFSRCHGLDVSWVTDEETPSYHEELLLSRGFSLGSKIVGMNCNRDTFVPIPLPDGIQIDKVNAEDNNIGLIKFLNGLYGDYRQYRQGVESIQASNAQLIDYVVNKKGSPIGFASLYHDSDKQLTGLFNGYVDPSERRKGIGAALASKRVQDAFEEGAINAISLSINPVSKKYLEKNGFQPILTMNVFTNWKLLWSLY